MEYINIDQVVAKIRDFKDNKPFSHTIVDNFFKEETAIAASNSFPAYDSEKWHVYKNAIEHKKTMNNWNEFNALQYKIFLELNSPQFVAILEELTNNKLFTDSGLHGGGLHIHSDGGNLNPHLDYSIHPKVGLQRKLNIIIYLEQGFKESYGGSLGLWGNESNKEPGKLMKEVFPKFNRAVIFDTTQNSWHGMSTKLTLPKGKYRKSFAIYYMQEPLKETDPRSRALFAPRTDQKDNPDVLELIKMRADEKKYSSAYRR